MKILLGMSGGLDSTYAACLLREQGHDVTGARVLMHEETSVDAAEKAAREAGVPLMILDARDAFDKKVIAPFCEAYLNARTPNPCVLCNPAVKFAFLCEAAKANGFDKIATGHYADVARENGRYFIRKGADGSRDQSYVLYALSQEQLSLLTLPLAGYRKEDLRPDAENRALSSVSLPESREICFIPSNDHASFIEAYTGKPLLPGDFVDETGRIVGRHRGIGRYTIGQRKGLGLAMNGHVFVTAIDPALNRVTVTRGEGLFKKEAVIRELVFQKQPPQDGVFRASVKIRYGAKPAPASVLVRDDAALLSFDEPVRALTPGQSAVCYDGDDLLMGGTITEEDPSLF